MCLYTHVLEINTSGVLFFRYFINRLYLRYVSIFSHFPIYRSPPRFVPQLEVIYTKKKKDLTV